MRLAGACARSGIAPEANMDVSSWRLWWSIDLAIRVHRGKTRNLAANYEKEMDDDLPR